MIVKGHYCLRMTKNSASLPHDQASDNKRLSRLSPNKCHTHGSCPNCDRDFNMIEMPGVVLVRGMQMDGAVNNNEEVYIASPGECMAYHIP